MPECSQICYIVFKGRELVLLRARARRKGAGLGEDGKSCHQSSVVRGLEKGDQGQVGKGHEESLMMCEKQGGV